MKLLWSEDEQSFVLFLSTDDLHALEDVMEAAEDHLEERQGYLRARNWLPKAREVLG